MSSDARKPSLDEALDNLRHDIALGLHPLEPGQYPPVRMLWELSEEGAA
ncbi:hypothetical protein [Nocardia sp. FDAARGOS_372]|nr:hypothetical protein [Nocardia sp. FDAARGOS_372]